MAWTGWPMWRAWLDTTAAVPFVGYLNNASLWAIAARAGRTHTVMEVGWLAAALILGVGVVILAMTHRERDLDRRWMAALLFALLLSPLGWIYYVPLLIGPLVSALRNPSTSRIFRASLVGFAIPAFALGSWRAVSNPAVLLTVASIYTWSVLSMWLFLAMSNRTSRHPNENARFDYPRQA